MVSGVCAFICYYFFIDELSCRPISAHICLISLQVCTNENPKFSIQPTRKAEDEKGAGSGMEIKNYIEINRDPNMDAQKMRK
jgi:hypothetical protein